MSEVSFIFTDESITVSFPVEKDGETEYQTKSVVKDSKEYDEVISAIREERYGDIPNLISPAQRVIEFSEGNIDVRDGVVFINNEEVPSELSARIIKFADQDLPYMPLVKFFENLSKNPSYRSVQQTFKFLEANHYPLTPDGCFVAYKKVREDFLDGYSKKFDNSPGKVVSMPRNKVDEDPDRTCSYGLHVASYQYAHGYSGQVMVEVKVNPKDVVAVPSDYSAAKMRVCEYIVLGVAEEKHDEELVGYVSSEQRERWNSDRMHDWDSPDSYDDEKEDDEDYSYLDYDDE